jgi:hypothetical protein
LLPVFGLGAYIPDELKTSLALDVKRRKTLAGSGALDRVVPPQTRSNRR